MTAVLLALASAALFGGMTVALRLGLRGLDDASGAALATVILALGVALVAAALDLDLHGAWPFLLAGLLAPGASQILFTLAVGEVGASRTSVMVGGAPLVAVAIALVFLDEPLSLPLLLGAVAIVSGGALLAAERDRPGDLRRIGLVYAAAAAVLFATRDNLARALHTDASPGTAAAATLVAGTVAAALWTRRAPTSRELRRLAPAGLLFGLSYVCLFEAYFRGQVTVVSPLIATESLWGVGLSALLIRQTEGMGRRIAIGAAARRRRRRPDRRDREPGLAVRLGVDEDDHERDDGDDHACEPAADPAGDRDDRDAEREVAGVNDRRDAAWRGVRAAIRSSMWRVDLALDPVEEALDQLLVVGRPELLARGERRRELLLEGRFAHPGIVATGTRWGKPGS